MSPSTPEEKEEKQRPSLAAAPTAITASESVAPHKTAHSASAIVALHAASREEREKTKALCLTLPPEDSFLPATSYPSEPPPWWPKLTLLLSQMSQVQQKVTALESGLV